MSIRATTEPMYFPGSGTWKQVPINRGPGTPGIIDHYPEGPGEKRPWEPPFSNNIGYDFGLGTNPFGGGLAGRYLAQLPNKLTPVQAAAKSFGDIPILGNLINTIRDYEDRINYRNADPEMRRLLGLE